MLSAAALAYGALLLLVYFFQDRLLYFPTRDLFGTPRDRGFEYEEVRLTTSDGVGLHGWFVPAPAARATVLYLHGNGGNISHRLERIALLRSIGLNVFIFDYRGYGQSEGRPGEEGTYDDARAAWRYLTQTRGIPASEIVPYGVSLGGAIAAKLCAEEPARALIIDSSFTSVPDLGADVYSWLPVRWLGRFEYATKDHITRVRSPVLVIHSRDDEIIPFRHGEQLYAAAGEPKQLLEILGGHNDNFYVSRAQYLTGIDAFLRTQRR